MTMDGELLKDACDQVMHDSSLAPKKDKSGKIIETHCNEGALLVARAMGCREFEVADGEEELMADAMCQLMSDNVSGNWEKVDGSTATLHALSGGLGFAAMSSYELGEAHGHIAAIYPVGMQESGSLGHDVPMVANVGVCLAEEKSSQAFPVSKGEANYYIFKGE